MERTKSGSQFGVKWYLHVTHPRRGVVRGRTMFVSTSGLTFVAPIRFHAGDQVELEIFIRTTESLRCKARICADGSPFQAEFISFPGEGLKAWNDILLGMHRARVNRR